MAVCQKAVSALQRPGVRFVLFCHRIQAYRIGTGGVPPEPVRRMPVLYAGVSVQYSEI